MSTKYNPSIVKDNLVLYLDAANTKSYPGSGTTWKDISGKGNNQTLTNGPTFDSNNLGSISFDGTNDFSDGDFTSDVQFGTGDFTFSFWLLLDSSGTNQNVFDTRRENTTGNRACFMLRTTGNTTYNFRFANESLKNFSAPVDVFNNIVISRISGTINIYVNNSLSQSFSNTSNNNVQGKLRLGAFIDSAQAQHVFHGKFSQFMVYKGRGLTAAEVQRNYNSLKSRFGI